MRFRASFRRRTSSPASATSRIEDDESAESHVPELKDLRLATRTFLATYPWRKIAPMDPAPLRRPLGECRLAVVSSAGFVVPGEAAFDASVKGGDWSWRMVPDDVDLQGLEEHHRSSSFDHAGIEADRNLAMPLDRLRELEAAREIGGLAPRHVSVMGSITAPGRFIKHSVPEIVELLRSDEVDVALMVPV